MEIVAKPQIRAMTDMQRHEWLEFIAFWLSGRHMVGSRTVRKQNIDLLQKWRELAALFPPQAITMPLYRFNPAPGRVSSWTRNLVGLDAVAGIATDMVHNYGSHKDKTETARIGIKAMIPGGLILATPRSIRDAFMALSHDYFERYKEVNSFTMQNGVKHWNAPTHPGYPGTNPNFTMDDVGFLQDVLNRPGGHYRQYEYIVQTPPRIAAEVVMRYRVGDEVVRQGDDDPHHHDGAAPRVRRNVR